MSTYETITFEHADRIALVTINRPDSLNALNQQVMAEVADVFARIDRDKDIAVSVLTGEGRAPLLPVPTSRKCCRKVFPTCMSRTSSASGIVSQHAASR